MTNQTTPTDKEAVVEKINNGDVKVKATLKGQKPKANTQKPTPKAEQQTHVSKEAKPTAPVTPASQVTHEKLNFTEEQLITAVKAIGHPASSREISDKLSIKDRDQGRAYIRSRMKTLMKDKKILGIEPKDKSRCTFLYSTAK